jgi:hypothetical protein
MKEDEPYATIPQMTLICCILKSRLFELQMRGRGKGGKGIPG